MNNPWRFTVLFIHVEVFVKLIRMSCLRRFPLLAFLAIVLSIFTNTLLAYDTIGNGYGSKWGEDPNAGTGGVLVPGQTVKLDWNPTDLVVLKD